MTASFPVVFSLEDAPPGALPSRPPNRSGTATSARVEFYDKFRRAADEYDRDFVKKCDEDLNITLVFVGVFAYTSIVVSVSDLLEGTGWFILRRYVRFHCRRPRQARARFPRNEPRSP